MDKKPGLMLLDDLIENYDSYKSSLMAPKNPEFLETLSGIKDFITQLESANAQWQGADYKTTAIVEAPRRIKQLRNLYEKSYDATLYYITQEFEKKQRELSRSEVCVFEEKKNDLDEIIELYERLKSLSPSQPPKTIGKIENYINFSEEVTPLNKKFDKLLQYYQNLDFGSESEIALLQHELRELTKAYKNAVSNFKPRISLRRTIFDLPQRFDELRGLGDELSYLRNNLKEALKVKQDLETKINDLKETLEYLSSEDVSLAGLGEISPEKISQDYELLSHYPSFKGIISDYDDLRKEVEERVVEAREKILETKETIEPVESVQIIETAPRIEPLPEPVKEMVEDMPEPSKESIYKNMVGIGESRPFMRNESNFFDLPTYLDFIGFPPAKYLMLMNIILGRGVKSDGWINRLELLNREIQGLRPAYSLRDLDYLYHFYHALSEDMNRGNMDYLISRNGGYREVARKTLSLLSDYITSSEKSLKLTPEQIDAHQVNALENSYNRN